MKRKWIAALACLAMLAALGGCNGTGDVNDSTTSPNVSDGVENNNPSNLPNNAGGSANNPGNSSTPGGVTTPGTTGGLGGEVGTGMIGGSGAGTDGVDLDHDGRDDDVLHTTPGGNGDYNADDNGAVSSAAPSGRVRSVGNDLRDMANSAGRTIRDIL